jgi:hypothetical protein
MKTVLSSCLVLFSIVACSGGVHDAGSCDEITEKDPCVADHQCAWGTGNAGPHCFYVGEVKPL